MNIENARKFISSLQAVSITQNVYLSKTSASQFKIISDRDKKTINTENIAIIAAECLEALKTNTSDLGKLVSALRSYKQRVYTSKPWRLRIAAFFGCKSSAEKRIDSHIQNALENIRQNDLFEADFNSHDSMSTISISRKHDDETLMRLFYHKVLDSKTSRPKLDGNSFSTSISSLLEDLIRYESNSSYFSELRNNLIEELLFALLLSKLNLSDYSKHIVRKINELPEKIDGVRHAVLIPFANFHHAVLFVVEKGLNERFSFKVINTGKGANNTSIKVVDIRDTSLSLPQPSTISLDQSILNRLLFARNFYIIEKADDERFSFKAAAKAIRTGTGAAETAIMEDASGHRYRLQKNSIVHLKFTSVTSQKLSKTFFDRLQKLMSSSTDMSQINDFVLSQFAEPDFSNILIDREHKAQNNGTCTVKCLLACIKERLGKTEYRKFKLWMIEQEIQRFEEVRKRNAQNWSEKELLEMRQEAYAVLQKCRAKGSGSGACLSLSE